MKSIFFLLFIAVFHYSCAQISPSAMNDSTLLPPNTIRVKVKILSASESQATVQIVSVVGSGQGIINPLSEGQKITVQLPEGKKIKNGKTILADLKEKMGVDASQSSFTLLRFNE
jgi:hypothetical protein